MENIGDDDEDDEEEQKIILTLPTLGDLDFSATLKHVTYRYEKLK